MSSFFDIEAEDDDDEDGEDDDDDDDDEEEEEDFCDDKNENCVSWADNDECTKNPNYMLKNCCKSCGEQQKEQETKIMYACVDLKNKCKRWHDDQ